MANFDHIESDPLSILKNLDHDLVAYYSKEEHYNNFRLSSSLNNIIGRIISVEAPKPVGLNEDGTKKEVLNFELEIIVKKKKDVPSDEPLTFTRLRVSAWSKEIHRLKPDIKNNKIVFIENIYASVCAVSEQQYNNHKPYNLSCQEQTIIHDLRFLNNISEYSRLQVDSVKKYNDIQRAISETTDFQEIVDEPERVRCWNASLSYGSQNLSSEGLKNLSDAPCYSETHNLSSSERTIDNSSNHLIADQPSQSTEGVEVDAIFQNMIQPSKITLPYKKKNYAKDNYCSICNNFQNRIDPHLIVHHKDTEGVKLVMSLPPGCLERRRKFAEIVKSMNYVWNTDKTINPTGIIIPTRRVRSKKDETAATMSPNQKSTAVNAAVFMKACPHCLGFYVSKTLHNHIRIQHPDKRNPFATTRDNLTRAKKMMGMCHERANLSENAIFLAELALDIVGAVARCDRNLASLLRVEHRHLVRDAIEKVAKLDIKTKRYGSIWNAETAPIVIKKLFVILTAEYLSKKSTKQDYKDNVHFETVFEDEIGFLIYHRATYSRKKQLRHRSQEELNIQPRHFKIFMKLVEIKQSESFNYFSKGDFEDGKAFAHFMNLLERTATSVLNFNGRRPTQTGGVLVRDYEFAKTANADSEYFKMLSEEDKAQRMKYKRVDMQGKKVDGDGHLFINKRNDGCLKMILKHRNEFGINHSNKYLFAIPTHPGQEETFLKLSPVFAKLAAQCKLLHPEILEKTVRATKIRSHHATLNSAMENGVPVQHMAEHLGHSQKTHEQRYKKHIDKTDVAVTKQLEALTEETEEQFSNILYEQAEVPGHLEPLSQRTSSSFRSSSPTDHHENSSDAQNSPTEPHIEKAPKSKPIIKSIKTVNVKGDSLQKERKNQLSKLARTQEFDWRAVRAAKQPRISIITAQYSTVELHSPTAQNSEEQDSHLSKDDSSFTYVRPQPAPGHHRSRSADPGPETFFNTGGTKETSSTATKKSLPRSTSDWDLSGNRDSTREPSTYETVYPEDHSTQV
ncbi:hypothetical protein QAD02_000517 [Eretmocerus hayati]|uniref:Uncharacterized protein n=1 Tax=Eretmocerus hayati TaxID=131215 RepID=A0ACC2NEP9_9HYME|nr:hypothetical protein QAD02_000517 [Eretmocerus hayati]